MTLIAELFPKLRTGKTFLNECLKSLVSEDPSTSNMVRGAKHCRNMNDAALTKFIDHSDGY